MKPKVPGSIDPAARQKLAIFTDLLLEWNSRINLTGFRTRKEIDEKLIQESIAALQVLSLPGNDIADFGSGAGVPGLIWAACRPDLNVTSIEIRQKKVSFQKEACRRAGIPAEIVCGHFPEAVQHRRFHVIVTRAIRFSESLWTSAQELLERGGMLVRFASEPASVAGWTSLQIAPRSFVVYFVP